MWHDCECVCAAWPKWHKFIFYKLEILDIFLVDNYGGAKPVTVEEYYKDSSEQKFAYE